LLLDITSLVIAERSKVYIIGKQMMASWDY